jgi:long-chain acyl-CoA synthetase
MTLPATNLAQLILDQAARIPDRPALRLHLPALQPVSDGMSYGELAQSLAHTIGALEKLGVQPGHSLGLLVFNEPAFVLGYFAALAMGVTVLPLNTRLTADELSVILQDAEVQWLITDAELDSVVADLSAPSVHGVIRTGDLPEEKVLGWPWPAYSLDRLLAEARTPDRPWPVPPETLNDQPAVLIYTSGTTGVPKGVMLTHRSLLADAWGNAQVIEATETDRFITISPLFHVFGQVNILLTAMLVGASVVLVRKFSPKAVLEAIERHRVTFMAAVPTMYLMMLSYLESGQSDAPSGSARPYDLGSLRVCHSGAAPMAKEVFKRVEAAFGAPVQEGYGLSEASSIVTSNPLHGVRKPGSVGLPIPGVTLAVLDEAMHPLPPGEIGEIHVQGDVVMNGYYRRPDLSALVLVNGWLKTKDMAYRDADGYVFIVDRRDDLMNIGGAKVYPREVEEVLFQHPAVQAAAVVGVRSSLYHEEIKAFVVLKNGLNEVPTKQSLQRFCREHLAEFKVPKVIEFVEAIPQGATGKILRKTLRQSESPVTS